MCRRWWNVHYFVKYCFYGLVYQQNFYEKAFVLCLPKSLLCCFNLKFETVLGDELTEMKAGKKVCFLLIR